MPDSQRAGRFVRQMARSDSAYRAFIPSPLPPDPPLEFGDALIEALSRADRSIGRLDGFAEQLPNPDLFVAMYVRREAVLSSQIEGTQSTLDDVLAFEFDPDPLALASDVEEIVNYVRAMNYGLHRVATLPLSLRLLRELHGQLLDGVRGMDKEPGEFRRSQNWIGSKDVSLSEASFVPPPPHEMNIALGDLERFLHVEGLPPLIHCGLVHAQFETIHPFLDGNGRVGRLLIAFQLMRSGVLKRPLLYLSYFLKKHRAEYYDRLMAVRIAGDWEGWLRFFLRGVDETAEEAAVTAREIVKMRDEHRTMCDRAGLAGNGLRAIDGLFQRPRVSVSAMSTLLGGVSFNTARRVIAQLEDLGIVHETTGAKRNRIYEYKPYLDLFRDTDEAEAKSGGPTEEYRRNGGGAESSPVL